MHDGPWRAATDLVWTRFDDSPDSVVFNPRSGDVHLLTESARFLWQTIADRDHVPQRELLAALASHIGIAVDGDLVSVTTETLAFMDAAGLIVPVLP